jgi:hypothetical protein
VTRRPAAGAVFAPACTVVEDTAVELRRVVQGVGLAVLAGAVGDGVGTERGEPPSSSEDVRNRRLGLQLRRDRSGLPGRQGERRVDLRGGQDGGHVGAFLVAVADLAEQLFGTGVVLGAGHERPSFRV